ncbi:HAD hydrolase-like protein [Streptomyces broussonetiae]|uniref:HAD hydrolase-like protein n=1 Tax=Streptomyces broussonetiae TaxID=2686304 RepID=A0A6I6N2R1_9ACTN|nr:HAD family hydrolase [Streptomyces broussonetiae]QHA06973.1 HAD hydrolase-like protein [Streptomyces broussonetiae]
MPLSDHAGTRLEQALATHRLVVFDLDGVLVDSNELKVECMREALAEFGPELVDPYVHEFRRTFGRSRREHFLAFHQDHLGGEQATGERFETFYERCAGGYAELLAERYPKAPLCPDADRLVRALSARGLPLYVATGTLTAEAERVLDGHGLVGEFRAVLGGEEPKARRLAAALSAEGAAPGEAVLLGDSRQDLLAAQAVGMGFVLVTGHGFFPPAQVLDGADGQNALVAAGLDPSGLLTGTVAYEGRAGR